MLLQEGGLLATSDKLSRFLPSFPLAQTVTLRQLLSHTAGVTNVNDDPRWLSEFGRVDRSIDQMVEYIAKLSPVFQRAPGTGWEYSNSNYVLLGAVIEKVTGEPLGKALKSRVFDRLHMNGTAMDVAEDVVIGRVSGYSSSATANAPGYRTSNTPVGEFRNARPPSTSAAAAGGLHSTLDDMLTWHTALFSNRVVSQASLDEMTSPALLEDGRPAEPIFLAPHPNSPAQKYGYGLILASEGPWRAIGHGGQVQGYSAFINTYPQLNLTIVTLANCNFAAFITAPLIQRAVVEKVAALGK